MIPVRNWGRLLFVAVALLLGWAGSHSRLLQANAANRDSIQYWATGRMLVEHRSPFDLDEVLKLQQSQGYQADRGLVSRIPPWTIPVMLPFGLLNPYWTWFLIVTFSAAALVASTRLGWALFGNNETRASDCYLSSYLFAPVLACFKTGQIDLFIVLGLLLFLRWHKNRLFLAGAALWLPFVKPHLFAVFGIVCIFWIFQRRQWTILTGFAITLALSVAAAIALDHSLFTHYLANVRGQAIDAEFIPSLAGLLRLLTAPHVWWVQFVPLGLGVAWAVWFWFRHRGHWCWISHGLTVLLVSVLVSPYSFFHDEVVLLPALFQAAVWMFRRSTWPSAALWILGALNSVLLVMVVVNMSLASGAYVWSGLVWAAWFVFGRQETLQGFPAAEIAS